MTVHHCPIMYKVHARARKHTSCSSPHDAASVPPALLAQGAYSHVLQIIKRLHIEERSQKGELGPGAQVNCLSTADELHELLQKEKEQGVQPDSEHAVDAYLKASDADTPDRVITEVSSARIQTGAA